MPLFGETPFGYLFLAPEKNEAYLVNPILGVYAGSCRRSASDRYFYRAYFPRSPVGAPIRFLIGAPAGSIIVPVPQVQEVDESILEPVKSVARRGKNVEEFLELLDRVIENVRRPVCGIRFLRLFGGICVTLIPSSGPILHLHRRTAGEFQYIIYGRTPQPSRAFLVYMNILKHLL